jgi:hypothetical protein
MAVLSEAIVYLAGEISAEVVGTAALQTAVFYAVEVALTVAATVGLPFVTPAMLRNWEDEA